MVFRAEQVRIGLAREIVAGTGYAVPMGTYTVVAGGQTQFPNPIISGFDTLEQLDVKPLKARAKNASAAQREVFQLMELKRTVEDSFQFAVTNGLWLAKAFGIDSVTDPTDSATASTTLGANATPGASTVTLISGTGFANGDYIQIGTTGTDVASEFRLINSGGGTTTITLDLPLTYTHTSGATVKDFHTVTVIQHVITPTDTLPFPTTTLELDYLDSTGLSLYLKGVAVDSVTVSGGETDILNGTVNFKAFQAVKNTGALSTITAATVKPYNFSMGSFTYYGASIARVQDFSLTYNNGGKVKVYHNATQGQYAYEYITGAAEYTLDTTIIPSDTTVFDALKTSGPVAATILYTRGTNDTIQFSFTNCEIKQAPHSVPEEAEVQTKLSLVPRNLTVTVTLPGSAYYDVWV